MLKKLRNLCQSITSHQIQTLKPKKELICKGNVFSPPSERQDLKLPIHSFYKDFNKYFLTPIDCNYMPGIFLNTETIPGENTSKALLSWSFQFKWGMKITKEILKCKN